MNQISREIQKMQDSRDQQIAQAQMIRDSKKSPHSSPILTKENYRKKAMREIRAALKQTFMF